MVFFSSSESSTSLLNIPIGLALKVFEQVLAKYRNDSKVEILFRSSDIELQTDFEIVVVASFDVLS